MEENEINPLIEAIQKGQVCEFEPPITEEEKAAMVKAVSMEAGRSLMWLFYQFKLKNGIETMFINDGDKQEFILSFKTVKEWEKHTSMLNSDKNQERSVANVAE